MRAMRNPIPQTLNPERAQVFFNNRQASLFSKENIVFSSSLLLSSLELRDTTIYEP